MDEAASIGSTLSWNTFLSRTSVSSLGRAAFSEQASHSVHDLDDVIRAVKALNLRRYRFEEIAREEKVGEGETYMVERCMVRNHVLAIKHLKTNLAPDDRTFRRRLRSVILELQIMRHGPLRNHPNFPTVFGYGWNTRSNQVMPYILVQYAPYGTLRQYLQHFGSSISLRDVEILTGDVASALSALHTCGIVHGDVKLDNVLMVHSWDRPAKALAKLTDFGHALVMSDKSRKHGDGSIRYGGTVIYNAPEVHNQDMYPIDPVDLPKCDTWAFGLLVWEACIQGEEYLSYVADHWPTENCGSGQNISPVDLLRYAKHSIPGGVGIFMLIRAAFHMTIQEDPSKRTSNLQRLPIMSKWHASGVRGLEADLALHLESPSPTYEMFRSENGREIPWTHEEQMFQGLKRTHVSKQAKDNASISWQIALCYYVGFGTSRSSSAVYEYAHMAKREGHPAAKVFADLFDPEGRSSPDASTDTYAARVSKFLRSSTMSQEMPPLVKACFDGHSNAVISLLSDGEYPNSPTIDGCTAFHWFFMLEDPATLSQVVDKFRSTGVRLLVDAPFSSLRTIHDQWPLQLLGSPLALQISVNSLAGVRALLSLGADPLRPVYREEEFPSQDPRSEWTALHLAAKYHCSDILLELLTSVSPEPSSAMTPLACVLSFSTSLERLAMHGKHCIEQLDKTIATIRKMQSLKTAAPKGMTALMQAIDFQDNDVVAALLRAEPELATTPLRSPHDKVLFNLPIHFAAQIAARRNVPESLQIIELINDYTNDLSDSKQPSRDNLGMTSLHLAVTGPSCRTTQWILEKRPGLLHVEDFLSRTALHCCASASNCDVLLSKGAGVDHTDKFGMTALHRACLYGELDLVQSLLKHKPKLDLKNNRYGSPLHCAVINGSRDVVMALLDADAPLNARDMRGNTPVHVAARMTRLTILRTLIDRGADRDVKNDNGRTPENIAADTGLLGSIRILRILQSGRNIQISNYFFSDDKSYTDYKNYTDYGFRAGRVIKAEALPDFIWDPVKDTVSDRNEGGEVIREERTLFEDDDQKLKPSNERDERKNRLIEIIKGLSDVYVTRSSIHWPSAQRSRADTVELIKTYFDDKIWQPPMSNDFIKHVIKIVFGISKIMKNTDILREEHGRLWEPIGEALSTEKQEYMAREVENIEEKVAINEDQNLPTEPADDFAEDTEDFVVKAAKNVAAIVEAMRPCWVLPRRNKEELEEMIIWEIKRHPSEVETNQTGCEKAT